MPNAAEEHTRAKPIRRLRFWFLGCMGLPALGWLALWVGCNYPTWATRDDVLLSRFHEHSESLAKLLALASELGRYWTSGAGDSLSKDILDAMADCGVRSIEKLDSGSVRLEVRHTDADLLNYRWESKGYAYLPSPPKNLLNSLDSGEPTQLGSCWYRHISGRWYLYLESGDED